tara:strand:- start:1106 stop:1459 length:354 start_codon:yes stop_codon:yes gene_type:complete
MSVSVNSCTWKIGECEASFNQLVGLFGQPIKCESIDGKVPYEWVIGFLNIKIYPYKFEPIAANKPYKFSIGGTSTGQVIALQSFLEHVSLSNIWSEFPACDECPALGVVVSAYGEYE